MVMIDGNPTCEFMVEWDAVKKVFYGFRISQHTQEMVNKSSHTFKYADMSLLRWLEHNFGEIVGV